MADSEIEMEEVPQGVTFDVDQVVQSPEAMMRLIESPVRMMRYDNTAARGGLLNPLKDIDDYIARNECLGALRVSLTKYGSDLPYLQKSKFTLEVTGVRTESFPHETCAAFQSKFDELRPHLASENLVVSTGMIRETIILNMSVFGGYPKGCDHTTAMLTLSSKAIQEAIVAAGNVPISIEDFERDIVKNLMSSLPSWIQSNEIHHIDAVNMEVMKPYLRTLIPSFYRAKQNSDTSLRKITHSLEMFADFAVRDRDALKNDASSAREMLAISKQEKEKLVAELNKEQDQSSEIKRLNRALLGLMRNMRFGGAQMTEPDDQDMEFTDETIDDTGKTKRTKKGKPQPETEFSNRKRDKTGEKKPSMFSRFMYGDKNPDVPSGKGGFVDAVGASSFCGGGMAPINEKYSTLAPKQPSDDFES